MRTIAQISDLHFGREEPAIVAALLAELRDQAPALVVVSGDLTQRATRGQFAAARAFLDQLPAPALVIPGNHDVPLYDLGRRLFDPFGRYRRHIGADLEPRFGDAELAVLGVNTAHGLTVKGGRVTAAQLARLARELATTPAGRTKIVVTHHPFLAPPGDPGADVVADPARALAVLDAGGAELLLAGHLHRGYAADVRTVHPATRSMLAVQCGTSVSTRVRGEPNSYNLIRIAPGAIEIRVRRWAGAGFTDAARTAYAHRGQWDPVEVGA